MKKIFIISSVLLVLVLMLLGVYNFAFKKQSAILEASVDNTKVGEFKAEPSISKIEMLSEAPIKAPTIDKKNKQIKYYSDTDGTVWSMNSDGGNKKIQSDFKIPGLKKVTWSPDSNKVLTVVNSDNVDNFYQFDHSINKGIKLKNGIDSAVWDMLGNKIFYKHFDPVTKSRTLNISNPDGSDWQKITDIFKRDVQIAPVPLSSFVSFWNLPDAFEETSFNLVGIVGGQPKTLLQGKFGADYLWSPDGTQALVSSVEKRAGKIMTLGLINQQAEYTDLGIPTIVSKCLWAEDGKTIYFALPGGIPDDSIMPNDYINSKFFTEDTFWKLDIATGKRERIIEINEIQGKFDSTNLMLSADEEALLFVNRADKQLYKIML